MTMTCPLREFRSRTAFVDWLREFIKTDRHNPTHHDQLYVAYDPRSWRFMASIGGAEEKPESASYSFPLPKTLKQGGQIWDDIQEQHICVYYLHDSMEILIAIRNGLWESFVATLFRNDPRDFREITDDQAQAIINDRKEFSKMCAELYCLGISCRRLPTQAKRGLCNRRAGVIKVRAVKEPPCIHR